MTYEYKTFQCELNLNFCVKFKHRYYGQISRFFVDATYFFNYLIFYRSIQVAVVDIFLLKENHSFKQIPFHVTLNLSKEQTAARTWLELLNFEHTL